MVREEVSTNGMAPRCGVEAPMPDYALSKLPNEVLAVRGPNKSMVLQLQDVPIF